MRREYGLDRDGVARLPWWEREVLFAAALKLNNIELGRADYLPANSDEAWNLPPAVS